jgi:hypothetical protein
VQLSTDDQDDEDHTTMTTTAEPPQTDPRASAAQRRAAARTRDLTALLRQRPDLAGVHAPADFAVDAVRWSA